MKKKIFQRKDFDQVKLLLNADVPSKMVKQITGWGTATVSRVKNSVDYQAYCKNRDEINSKQKARRVSKKAPKAKVYSPVDEVNNNLIADILIELKAQTDELRKLRGQLVGIEAQLATLKTKKKWL